MRRKTRSQAGHIGGPGVVHLQNRVRIAQGKHIHRPAHSIHRDLVRRRLPCGVERNLLRGPLGTAERATDLIAAGKPGAYLAAGGSQGELARPGVVIRHQRRNAQGAVAALAGLPAVSIENAVFHGFDAIGGPVHPQKLIETHAPAPIRQRTNALRGGRRQRSAQHNHEVVAGSLHLGKALIHGKHPPLRAPGGPLPHHNRTHCAGAGGRRR